MPDYSKGKIYKILNDIDNEVYIGSTVVPLSDRMGKHRACVKHDSTYKLHQHMKTIGVEHFYIELLEHHSCDNVEELRAKEGEWIRKVGTLNQCIAGRTDKQYRVDNREIISEKKKQYRIDNRGEILEKQKQYRIDHREEILEKKKQYRIDNREKIKERCVCECGTDVNKNHISRHRKTNKHKQLMEELYKQ